MKKVAFYCHAYGIGDILSTTHALKKVIKARGGGATSFAPPYEWVEKFNWQPESLIYLTDGFGRPPKEAPDYPVIWASCGTTEFVDWGEVIGIDS